MPCLRLEELPQRGSLRHLKHYRGKQLIEEVDAYELLLHGVSSELKRLENGDSLLVPPMGAQVTVGGMVRRPAIYELRGESSLGRCSRSGRWNPACGGACGISRCSVFEAHEKRTMLTLNLSPDSTSDCCHRAVELLQDSGRRRDPYFPDCPLQRAGHLSARPCSSPGPLLLSRWHAADGSGGVLSAIFCPNPRDTTAKSCV